MPSATPTPTNTPVNVLATLGANIDIAANTAIPGAVNNLCGPSLAPGCGQTVEQAIPQLAPWGTVFDAGVYTGNTVAEKVGSDPHPPTTNGTIYTSIAIPTSLIPLLIFAFGL